MVLIHLFVYTREEYTISDTWIQVGIVGIHIATGWTLRIRPEHCGELDITRRDHLHGW